MMTSSGCWGGPNALLRMGICLDLNEATEAAHPLRHKDADPGGCYRREDHFAPHQSVATNRTTGHRLPRVARPVLHVKVAHPVEAERHAPARLARRCIVVLH